MWWLPSADAGPVSRAAPPTTEVTESSINQFNHIYNTLQNILYKHNQLCTVEASYGLTNHTNQFSHIYNTVHKHNQLEASYGLINHTNQFSHIYNTVQYIQTQPARSQLWSYQPHKPVISYIQYNTLQNIQTVMVLSTTQSSSIIYTTQYRTYKHNQLEASYGLINHTIQFSHIYNNNRKIAKVNRLHSRIEPFPVLFWALGIVLAHILKLVTQPSGLASLSRRIGTDCTPVYGRGPLGSI